MSAPAHRIRSFADFWPYYLREHRNPVCRGLHYFGTTAALATLAVGIVTLKPVLVLGALVAGYGPAWIGHFVFERNRPATFTYPRWSLMADLKLYAYFISGRTRSEYRRLLIGDGR